MGNLSDQPAPDLEIFRGKPNRPGSDQNSLFNEHSSEINGSIASKIHSQSPPKAETSEGSHSQNISEDLKTLPLSAGENENSSTHADFGTTTKSVFEDAPLWIPKSTTFASKTTFLKIPIQSKTESSTFASTSSTSDTRLITKTKGIPVFSSSTIQTSSFTSTPPSSVNSVVSFLSTTLSDTPTSSTYNISVSKAAILASTTFPSTWLQGLCEEGQVECREGGRCVRKEAVCDGRTDCLENGEDEWGCLDVLENGILTVGPQHLPVCWQGWEETAGEAACHQMGFSALQSAQFHQTLERKGPWWMRKSIGDSSDWFQAQGEAGECESGTAVGLQCAPHTCGGWGKTSTVPSLALLLHVASRKSCPASLISATHLLAAASCLDQLTLDPRQWVVFPGLTSSRQIKVVAAITKFEEVILLRMDSPATLGPASQPACLLSTESTLATPSNCVLASWAVADQGDVSFAQHVAPLTPLSTGCPPNFLCTKALSSPTPLPGSPLLCSQPEGTWFLQGLLLRPRDGNNNTLFISVAERSSWLESLISSLH